MNDTDESLAVAAENRAHEIQSYGASAGLPHMANLLVIEGVTVEAAKRRIDEARAAQLLSAFHVWRGDVWT